MVGQGDRKALSDLFRRHAEQVWSIGRRILRDPSEAEDLVQDVFLYIFRKAGLYDRCKGPARSWLIQVTYTQAFQRRRKLRSHGLYEILQPGIPGGIETSLNGSPVYDHTVEGLFGRNRWRQIVKGMSEEQRETLRLHFFEGYTFAEIAEKLKQTHTNVRHHYYRGLEKLRKQLSDEEWNERSSA